MKRELKVLLVGACAVFTGCATMANRGGVHRVAPDGGPPGPGGPTVKVAELELHNFGYRDVIYEGGHVLSVRDGADSRDRTFYHANCVLGYFINKFENIRRAQALGCPEDYINFPMVDLELAVPHTLRIVRGDREATVTVRASMHWGWLWANGVWFAFAPVGWAVDLVSGSMRYYGGLDVTRALDRGGR